MAGSTTIDVKTAVRIALQYLQEFSDVIPIRDIRLEETEYDDSGYWLITLSAHDNSAGSGGLVAALGGNKRDYKIFRIDASTGEVKSMKVRSLQPID